MVATPRLHGPARSLTPSPALRRRRRLAAAYVRASHERARSHPTAGTVPFRTHTRWGVGGRHLAVGHLVGPLALARRRRLLHLRLKVLSPPPKKKKRTHIRASENTPPWRDGRRRPTASTVAALASALAEFGHLRDVAQLLLDVAGDFLLRRRREAVPPAPKPSPHPRPGQRQRRQNGIVGTRLLSGRHS